VLKKATFEQSASDAAKRLFLARAWVWGDVRAKPISMMGTERNRPVTSQRLAGVANDSWTLRVCYAKADLANKRRTPQMAASSTFMINEAERRFPVRIRIGVPPGGLGSRLDGIKAWLDENCGASGWAMTPSGTRGVLNDALSIYFGDPTLASAFVARWCAGYKVETTGGVFQVREDEPMPRVGATLHRTP
jgi:hypothetical protein